MSKDRIAGLRALEAECYGVCLYMLQEEKSAAKAAQAALKDVYRDDEFWRMPEEERGKKIWRIAVSRALERRAGGA